MKVKYEYLFYFPKKNENDFVRKYLPFASLKEAKKAALKAGVGSTIHRKVEKYREDGYSISTDIVWNIIEQKVSNKIYKFWISYYPHLKKSERKVVLISAKFA